MDNQPEPPLSALRRLALVAGDMDLRTAEVVICHVAIEREVNLALAKLVPNPERLGGLPLAHGLKVLAALWTSSPSEHLAMLLRRWDELRNHMAHGRSSTETEKHLQRLKDAALATGVHGVAEGSITVVGLAAFTCHLLSEGGRHGGLVHLLQMQLSALTADGKPLVATLNDAEGELARGTLSLHGNTFLTARRAGRGQCALYLHLSNGAVEVVPLGDTNMGPNDTLLVTTLAAPNSENAAVMTIK